MYVTMDTILTLVSILGQVRLIKFKVLGVGVWYTRSG
jgi:hypothetical protein